MEFLFLGGAGGAAQNLVEAKTLIYLKNLFFYVPFG